MNEPCPLHSGYKALARALGPRQLKRSVSRSVAQSLLKRSLTLSTRSSALSLASSRNSLTLPAILVGLAFVLEVVVVGEIAGGLLDPAFGLIEIVVHDGPAFVCGCWGTADYPRIRSVKPPIEVARIAPTRLVVCRVTRLGTPSVHVARIWYLYQRRPHRPHPPHRHHRADPALTRSAAGCRIDAEWLISDHNGGRCPVVAAQRPRPHLPLSDAERFAQSLRDSEEADRRAKQAAADRKAEAERLKAEAADQAARLAARKGGAPARGRAGQGSQANGQGCRRGRPRVARGEGGATRARDRQTTGLGGQAGVGSEQTTNSKTTARTTPTAWSSCDSD